MNGLPKKQISAPTAGANQSNRKEEVRASSLLKVHATGIVGPLTPEERSEWKRRRQATTQQVRAFQRLNDLVRLVRWRRQNGIVIEDSFQALALLIADAMAVVRHRAIKRYRDLNYPNFKFRAKRMGILFPEQAVMAALHEVSERLQRKGKDYRLYSGSTAGRMLNLSHIERVEAEAWTLAAVDVSAAETKALAHERKLGLDAKQSNLSEGRNARIESEYYTPD